MPKYHIEVPYTGRLIVELESESAEAAIDLIYDTPRDELEKLESVDFVESEEGYHEQVVQGNVFYGVLNRRVVEELPEDEE